jgi:hypothetical protein
MRAVPTGVGTCRMSQANQQIRRDRKDGAVPSVSGRAAHCLPIVRYDTQCVWGQPLW